MMTDGKMHYTLAFVAFACICNCQSLADKVKRADKTYILTTIEEPPYVTIKEDAVGNDKFQGFIPDLVKMIANQGDFNYEFRLVADGLYGSQDGENWNGMMGEIMDGTADMAAAPLTISDDRKGAVTFSEPFLTFGNIILAKKPKSGSELPFKNAKELVDQSEVKYGIVKDGVTQTFLSASSEKVYQDMWDIMSAGNNLLVNSVADGVTKIRKSDGKYACVIESSTAEYWVQQEPCDLQIVGEKMNVNHYGFALPKGADGTELLEKVNPVLKKLKVNGEVAALKKKWWETNGQCNSGYHTQPVLLTLVGSVLFTLLHL